MTSAIPPTTQNTTTTQSASSAPTIASSSNLPQSGAVPAPLPGRSYASATKTASTSSFTPAGASAPSQNAKPTTESPVNGATPMAQGGPQAASAVPNGTPATEHGRKPSVIISASGASGSTPNGGPVGQNGRPPISFGSMNSQGSPLPPASVPYQSQTSSLPTPRTDPRVISPAHSPSPIPQPPASGGRPPSSFPNQSNGMTFGSMGGESDPVRPTFQHLLLVHFANITFRCARTKCKQAWVLAFQCMSEDSLPNRCRVIPT
jgi:translation initiation factor 4G